MHLKKLFPILVFVFLGFYCSDAIAVAPLGPPASNLGKGKYSFGLDYTYSKMGLEFDNGASPGGGPAFKTKFKTNAVYVSLSRGITDDWEIFFRMGAGDTRATDDIGTTHMHIHDVDRGYSFGFGTKWNFWRPNEKLTVGGIYQILWTKVESNANINNNRWRTDTDYTEMQFAVGPEYKIRDNITLYGGGFINLLQGDMTAKQKVGGTGRISYDVRSDSLLGGFVGSRIAVNKNTSFAIEWQHTAAMNLIGLNLTFLLN